ncbi:hypothetical protein HB662_03905 [Roseomonas frigidaquae]|uniref:Zeta toxin domain-containing protein n=1 Tax=Falsiroseomonas frigidaquae TaxID=487318 RepID=A0ABX1EUZ0_9PROT|nr:zeta toxin family protein [Falsiroseomonas frigidaquae]NKE43908.1 hypothetical protein [Falsiroseomonas frigidaquae]
MTRADKCLADAVAAGKISEATAANARARVQQLLDKGVAEGEAMVRAAEEMAAAAAQRKRQVALRVIAAARTFDQASAHPRGFAAGVASIFARDAYGLAGHSNIEGRAAAIEAGAHARLVNLLDAYRSKALGFKQDLPGLRRFVSALYGDTRDAAAGGFARAWNDVTDSLLERFNAAGGNLPRRDTWRLPQEWDRDLVKRAGRGDWTAFMQDAIARGDLRMVDFDTGDPLAADRAAAVIDDAWQSISSNGVSDLVPGQPGGVALANRRAQPRAFEWTSAEAYLKFNDRFGVGDAGLFELLTGHVKGMARDIAMLEILGPNPVHQARVLMDQARKAEASDTAVHFLGNLWNHTTGQVNSPVNEGVATTFRNIRSWLMGAQLGSAVLSSVTDFATLQKAADWNGLPVTDVLRRYVSLLNPANAEDRKTAVRLGLIAQGWTQRALGMTRHQAEIVGRDLPGRIADFTMRVSGMSAHTQAAKWAFGMEFSAHLADRAGRTLDQLEPELQQSFARYGITAEDWDIIRTAGVWDQDGVRFILPEQIVGRPAEPPAPRSPEELAAGEGWRQRGEDLAQAEPPAGAWQRGDPVPEDIARVEQEALDPARHPPTHAIETPERQAQRAQWKAEVEAERRAQVPEIRQDRQAWIVLGAPASGKSTVIEPLAQRMGALLVDADDIKARIPEFRGGIGANAVHRESSRLAAEILEEAKIRGDRVALPMVGRDLAGLRQDVEELKEAGYMIHVVLADLPLDKAVNRAINRFRETGRYVPLDYIVNQVGDRPGANFEAIKGEAATYARYSTDVERGQPARFLDGTDILAAEPDPRGIRGDRPRGTGEGAQAGDGGAAAPGRGSAEVEPAAEAAARQATSRLLEMIQGETSFAVVEPGNLERAVMLGSSRPGTAGGEFRRATAQYKSFPVAMMSRHLMRGIEQIRGGDWGRYLATTAVSLTVMGAVAMQLKAIAQGKDPRDMTSPSFWGAAFFQGGGAGILGDFLNAGLNRADRGFWMTSFGGPTGGLMDDIAKLTGGNLQGLVEDKDTNFGRELARFVQKNTPGSSLWYGRLAMDRLLWDRLQYLLDPKAAQRWRELERRSIDQTNQRFWWAPGETSPERAPSLPAAIGGATP